MLLIYPPVAKACEPPAGIAKLAGALKSRGIPCSLLDMNLEGQLFLLNQPLPAPDTWTRRAAKHVAANVAALRDAGTYRSRDRYIRAVKDLSRVIERAGRSAGINAGLADYQDASLSPVRSADLIAAAEHPERSLFHLYFSRRLFEVAEKDRTIIGISLNYLSQALCAFALIGFIRRAFPGTRIILGGGLVTSWMRRPGWRNPFGSLVDHLIAGPGEEALLRVLRHKQGLQNTPVPDYEALPLERYFSPGFVLPYSASTGCYWNKCSFCPETAEGNSYIQVPVDQAAAHLDTLIGRTKPVLIHLLDNAISPALLRRLAECPPGAPWYGFARIGRELADPDFCRTLRRAGCVMVKLGLESGDQALLDGLQKGIELETASRALKNLHAAGIAAYVYLLFGTPAETITEARKTLAFVVKHPAEITFLNLAVFNMPFCSSEADRYATEPFYEGDLSLYRDFRHPRGWDRKTVRQFLDNEFRRNPVVSSILQNEPPQFTSNHAPFFCGKWFPGIKEQR
jgi:radical SAM superfamily enzyme YgiQ (UPF0313 family)